MIESDVEVRNRKGACRLIGFPPSKISSGGRNSQIGTYEFYRTRWRDDWTIMVRENVKIQILPHFSKSVDFFTPVNESEEKKVLGKEQTSEKSARSDAMHSQLHT